MRRFYERAPFPGYAPRDSLQVLHARAVELGDHAVVLAMRAEEVAPAAAVVEAAPTAEGGAAAEPEVIKKGKKEEEGEAPAAEAKPKKK